MLYEVIQMSACLAYSREVTICYPRGSGFSCTNRATPVHCCQVLLTIVQQCMSFFRVSYNLGQDHHNNAVLM